MKNVPEQPVKASAAVEHAAPPLAALTPKGAASESEVEGNAIHRLGRAIFAIVAVIWIFFEDFVWNNTLVAMRWLGKLPPIAWLESRIAKLPPYAALLAFLIPAAVLLPFKLAAFYLIAHGHSLLGVQVFIVAKLAGTALLARIFALTKSALMTINWFARTYNAFANWKQRMLAYVKSLSVYIAIRERMSALKAAIKRIFKK